MSGSSILRLITGVFEFTLAIPIIGGLIVIGSSYSVLVIMGILHIITLVISLGKREPVYGSGFGILTCLISWIPLVGWFMHLISGVLLLISAFQRPRIQGDRY
ncbi:hypothetical protein [Paenibacillus pini]|uniref:hypothetical protein n=1 Tax=Paenibacillus pini TaxID=669461 RepID=UPI000563412E|nr:hypothetical protein [Paenibacillus pini]